MSVFGGKKDPEMTPVPAPLPVPARRPMQISQAAAEYAQGILNLQEENEQLRQQYNTVANRVHLLESHIHDLKREKHELMLERDDYKHHYTHIWSAMQHAGAILVECMRAPQRITENNGDHNERIKEAVNKLETELRPAGQTPANPEASPAPA